MPSTSSGNLGTQQDNTKETGMTSKRAKPVKVEAIAETPEETAPVAEAPAAETVTDSVDEVASDTTADLTFDEILQDGRVRIDAIDDQILELVVRRMEVSEPLLNAKHSRMLNTRDKLRQEEILNRLSANVADLTTTNGVNMSEHQIRELFELLIRLGVDSFRKNVINRR